MYPKIYSWITNCICNNYSNKYRIIKKKNN